MYMMSMIICMDEEYKVLKLQVYESLIVRYNVSTIWNGTNIHSHITLWCISVMNGIPSIQCWDGFIEMENLWESQWQDSCSFMHSKEFRMDKSCMKMWIQDSDHGGHVKMRWNKSIPVPNSPLFNSLASMKPDRSLSNWSKTDFHCWM